MEDNQNTVEHRGHKRHEKVESRQRFMLRQVMNLLFMIGVVALVVLYFIRPGIEKETGYLVFGMFVVLLKISEMIIRYLPK